VASHGIEFRYPSIEGVRADLVLVTHEHEVLVTHEHFDHNAVDAIAGEPAVLRAPGTHESPIGEIVGIASEHDAVAGTQRGPNTIFRFTFDDLSVAHFGDFGQTALRPEQRSALGDVDVLFLLVGGGPTIGGAAAVAVVHELRPRLVVPPLPQA
jgi:L-ascorbate metabolism protein UlaG (beta-lactamase superfamily)